MDGRWFKIQRLTGVGSTSSIRRGEMESSEGAAHVFLVKEGQTLMRACLQRGEPAPYQLLAVIAAVHSGATSTAETECEAHACKPLYRRSPRPRWSLPTGRSSSLRSSTRPRRWTSSSRSTCAVRFGPAAEAREVYDAAIDRTDNVAERSLLIRGDVLPVG